MAAADSRASAAMRDAVGDDAQGPDAAGGDAFKGDIFPGVATKVYDVPAIPAGTYTFVCFVHPSMTGTITLK